LEAPEGVLQFLQTLPEASPTNPPTPLLTPRAQLLAHPLALKSAKAFVFAGAVVRLRGRSSFVLRLGGGGPLLVDNLANLFLGWAPREGSTAAGAVIGGHVVSESGAEEAALVLKDVEVRLLNLATLCAALQGAGLLPEPPQTPSLPAAPAGPLAPAAAPPSTVTTHFS
jgi:hypothetical protein